MTISDLTEREIIARIERQLPPAPDWLLVGIGDDAAVVEPERNRVEVLTVDAIVEGVHFDRAFVPPEAIGHRALAVNLSDIAAMGAAPRLALLSFALPPPLPADDFDRIIAGIVTLAGHHRLHVAGGNLTKTTGPLVIDITVAGTVKRRQALTRAGARPGDELYVSGTIGAAAAGLMLLKEARVDRGTKHETPSSNCESCVERYLRPSPRVRLGTLLARNRAASACMDLSDGLSDALYQVADASGIGISIIADALPIDAPTRAVFESRKLDPTGEAVSGGDDYELLVAVRPRLRRRLTAAMRHGGTPLTRIGICTDDRAVTIRPTADGAAEPLARRAFAHFR